MVDTRAIEVRYFAAAADASGCTTETLELPMATTVGDVSAAVAARHGADMARVLKVAAFLLDDELTRDAAAAVGDRIDVLPPFAGG
ncbi:MoaD/ThiS family protein [Antrihabitans cavernicola]|uniref:MoaD/ThiS family protein n=1 Tax=Antrihabitans cavernicola TaxID=2495913 RepID=A0A5A7SD97_9NOCA|nr:MoaD/ThiS family protein [Spelaeibacter cavernicola]KAA0024128.1 MoaD/ThiS family protein [Spelaeibacter cavernicola]